MTLKLENVKNAVESEAEMTVKWSEVAEMAAKLLVIAWAAWLALPLATSHLNVLISQAEVMKLLGKEGSISLETWNRDVVGTSATVDYFKSK